MNWGERDVSTSPETQGREPTSGLPGALCACGCGVRATKASGYRWGYHHDPAIPAQEKKQALQLGGRRGQMTPSDASRLFDTLEPASAESRTAFRRRLMELLAVGRLTGSMYRDLLAGLDGMTKDQAKAPAAPAAPLVVEIQKFGGNGMETGS
jgi:hypothetical protein